MIVIKSLGATAPEGAKKLYRDALVEEGTLFLVDFSNRGSLDNFSVVNGAKVYDLAREAGSALNVHNEGIVDTGSDLSLTPGRGFSTQGLEGTEPNQIMAFPGTLNSYLAQNNHNTVWVIWMRYDPDFVEEDGRGTQFIRTRFGSNGTSVGNIRMNIYPTSVVGTFGGSATPNNVFTTQQGSLFQVAYEFRGIGITNRVFVNGELVGVGPEASGFVDADQLEFGNSDSAEYLTDAAIYRTFVEDLSVSGRTAEEVVQKDYDYVHAQGEFEGIPQRPFVNTY